MIEDDPVELAKVGPENYPRELQKRTSMRMALGSATLRLREFREQHDIGKLRSELASILSAVDDEERQRARAVLVELLFEFEREVLLPGEALQEAIDKRFAEIESRWPGQRIALDLPRLLPGVFTPLNGVRSLPRWFHECLVAIAPEAFAANDETRLKFEALRREGKPVTIWHPGLMPWG
jgi:hypothetical protein